MEEKVYKMALIRYLASLTRKKNIPRILDYYKDIGWLTPELAEELKRYVQGVAEYEDARDSWELSPDEHMKALLYISLIEKGKEALDILAYPISLSNWIFEMKKEISPI